MSRNVIYDSLMPHCGLDKHFTPHGWEWSRLAELHINFYYHNVQTSIIIHSEGRKDSSWPLQRFQWTLWLDRLEICSTLLEIITAKLTESEHPNCFRFESDNSQQAIPIKLNIRSERQGMKYERCKKSRGDKKVDNI